MRRTVLALPLALASTALVVTTGSPAHAVAGPTLTNVGGVVRVTSGTDPLDLYLNEPDEHGAGWFRLTTYVDFASMSGCVYLGGTDYIVECEADRVVITGSAGVDEVLALSAPVPLEVHGGAGDDEIAGGSGADLLYGDGGKDAIGGYGGDDTVDGGDGDDWQLRGDDGNDVVTGGAGDDSVMGSAGDDTVSGGDDDDAVYGDSGSGYHDASDGDDTINGDGGDDELRPAGGTDVVNGGPGEDLASYDGLQEDGVTVEISLDRIANDGPEGQNDNVGPAGDVENVKSPEWFGLDEVVLTGDAGPNVLDATFTDAAVSVDGLGGDDEIWAWGEDDATELRGGDGNDEFHPSGDTVILGGAGNDEINGSGGNEQIDGGPGADQILAGPGNDVIESADGTVDTVSCGTDADIARVDANDVVAIDVVNLCESLTKVQPPKPDVTVPTKSRYRLNAKGVATFALTNNSSFTVNAAATAKTTKPVGSGQAALAADSAGKVGLKLTRAALRTVKRKGSLRATVTFVLKGNGQTTNVTRTVKFLKH